MSASTSSTRATAPAKIILLGEHAVVYDQPAIAVPVTQRRATVIVEPGRPHAGVILHAETLGRRYLLDAVPADEPLAFTVRNVLRRLGIRSEPDLRITITSTIPIASGLGSGAAVATALIRALSTHLGVRLSPEQVSGLVYETEKLHHGTPSGIDNTVIAFECPIWFRRDTPPELFSVVTPFHFLIADTGVASPTRLTVSEVRARWAADPVTYGRYFERIGTVVEAARLALESGDARALGRLMNANQELLRPLDVSAPANERLIEAALQAGAFGAKLSGGGRGGNIVVLIDPAAAEGVQSSLLAAGAHCVFQTVLEPI
ncbi:MAG TPA: mevalonate kinase [Chloroflexi bacterium]|nr:mevalonate kinase [Chloroflexota bacterium]